MSRKSSRSKRIKKYMYVYEPSPMVSGAALSYSMLKEIYYGEKPTTYYKVKYGDIKKSAINPDPEKWIELNFDFEEEQVFY